MARPQRPRDHALLRPPPVVGLLPTLPGLPQGTAGPQLCRGGPRHERSDLPGDLAQAAESFPGRDGVHRHGRLRRDRGASVSRARRGAGRGRARGRRVGDGDEVKGWREERDGRERERVRGGGGRERKKVEEEEGVKEK